ncbi:MAG: tetratricopeptide repeat-containing sensor histidine kinase [Sediminicola sp.]
MFLKRSVPGKLPFKVIGRILVFLSMIWQTGTLYGQLQEQDSLKKELRALTDRENFDPRDTLYINLLNTLGSKLGFTNSDSLLLLSNRALTISERMNYRNGMARSYINIGFYHLNTGDIDKGIEFNNNAIEIAEATHSIDIKLKALNNLGVAYLYKDDYANAFATYTKAIDLAGIAGRKAELKNYKMNLGVVYSEINDHELAMKSYREGLDLCEGENDLFFSGKVYANIGFEYMSVKKYDLALENINEAIDIFTKVENLDWLAYAYETKGRINLHQNRYLTALYWYDKSELLHSKIEDNRGKIDLLNGKAQAHLGLHNYGLAQKYADEAMKKAEKIQSQIAIQNCSETLYKLAKATGDGNTALKYHETYTSIKDTLIKNKNSKIIAVHKIRMNYEMEKDKLISDNNRALAKQKNYIYLSSAALIIFILLSIVAFNGRKASKRMTKRLQLQKRILLNRETELKEINGTKDKLFSIIGHDLRGPIGAIQSLLKLFKDGDLEREELWGFIPKIRNDIDHISFTLNNLLSWGQTQMKGDVTKPSLVSLEGIVQDNLNLLHEIAETKSIKMINKLAFQTLIWSDGDQIDIVVRNLLSNALKFTPENGMVIIDAEEKTTYWLISVRDSGVGMDLETQEKIFNPNSTLTTYGTNNEKGTGLGLSLCKEMIEKNNGTLWVESAPRKGSCFYFTLPKTKNRYKNVG